MSLKSELGIMRSHSKRQNSIDHVRLPSFQTAIVSIALSYTSFELFDVEEYHELEIYLRVCQDHWKRHHSIYCMRVPIHLVYGHRLVSYPTQSEILVENRYFFIPPST